MAGAGCVFITLSDFVKFLNRTSLVDASTAEADLLPIAGSSSSSNGGSGNHKHELAVDTNHGAYTYDMVQV